eukprot:NODE_2_length_91304_cov_0.692462.p44 type:complete len:214 gc:universal NODE_2_length_91304_cov_0.692462:54777-55418(+)
MKSLDLISIYFSTTVGRDKFYRLIQYFSRFLLEHSTGEIAAKLKSLISSASVTRKWLRLIRLDFFNPLVEEAFGEPKKSYDPVVQFLTTARNISMQLFFFMDHAILFQTLKIYNPSKIVFQNIKKRQMQFWALGIVLSILKQLHLINSYSQSSKKESQKFNDKKKILMDFLDLMIPLNSLSYLNFSEGKVGLLGTITAANGIYENYLLAKKNL